MPARAGTPSIPRSVAATRARAAGDGQRRIKAIQRSRLLAGAVAAIEEYGYAQTTVAHITARARVSRRTFYEIFENRDECLTALIGEALASVESEIAAACLEGRPWRERVRGGLLVLLSFFDREPVLARVCVVQALQAGSAVQDHREAILARLAMVLDEGRAAGVRSAACPALTAEGLVGAAFAIVHSRLQRAEHAPLTELVGELMGLIVLPYLGPAAARREQALPLDAPLTGTAPTRLRGAADPLQRVPMRLTYRTACVLRCIAEHPRISNRAVAELAGISDQGQVSKLLSRLERLGLTVNSGVGHARGEANAWSLTPLGEQVAERVGIEPIGHGRYAA